MAKLTPYFYSRDAKEQAAFYVSALGGAILQQMTYADAPGTDPSMKDKIIHMVFQAAGVIFYIADTTHEPSRQNSGFDLTLEFETEMEAQDAFRRLLDGGTVIMDLEKQFWGALFGRLQDRFGIKWQITTAPQS